MFLSFLLLVHLLGFAAFVVGALAQQQFMRSSSRAGLVAAVRDEYERLAAAVSTKVELTGLFVQVLSGVGIVVVQPYFLKQHWLHAKLTAVLVLLVLAHVDMINARRIVKARQARGEAADGEIAPRKQRQATVGVVVDVLIVAVLLLVTVLRTAF
jgi:uncharacterized membrane protein